MTRLGVSSTNHWKFSWAMRFGQPGDDALGPFEHDTKARFVSDVFENFGNDLIF